MCLNGRLSLFLMCNGSLGFISVVPDSDGGDGGGGAGAIFGRLPQQQQDVLTPPCGSCPAFGPRILLRVSTPTFYICSSPRAPECRSKEKRQKCRKKTSRGERTNEICISVRKSQLMEPLWVSKSAIYPPPRQEYTRFPGVCSKALMWPKKGSTHTECLMCA